MKKYKYSKLIEKDIIKRCPVCDGAGQTYGHGAFGESESSICYNCQGKKVVLNWDSIDKEK